MSRSKTSANIGTQSSVYDGRAQQWTGIDHDAPDVLLLDKDLRRPSDHAIEFIGEMVGEAMARSAEKFPLATGIPATVISTLADFGVRREAWKSLVRYVWHNARSVPEACVFFGVAALYIDRSYEKRMTRAELKAIRMRGEINGHRHQKVFKFRKDAVYRDWKPLQGYAPLTALLGGENGEWSDDAEIKGKRENALRAVVRAAWQDIDPGERAGGKWETTLRAAFMNFTALTAEDRDLLAFITQTEFSEGFDETRAAMCARRKRRVRRPMELNGYKALTAPGGKSEAAIKTYRKVQQGNHNRSGSKDPEEERHEQEQAIRELRDHDGVPIRQDLPRDPKALRAHLKRLADEAEAKRLAELCGVEPSEISLSKTIPDKP